MSLPQAKESGCQRTHRGGVETARRNPSLRNLIRIARVLGVTMAGLFHEM
jgi:transcriptional regulator with XRE-family HTH domain